MNSNNNRSYVTAGGKYVYLIGTDSMTLGGSEWGDTVYCGAGRSDRPVTKINPRYIQACALVRGRYDRDAKGGTQLLLRERGGARRALEDMGTRKYEASWDRAQQEQDQKGNDNE